ncbi:restriction endonuclease subunit S, partial [Chryseobacterium sp. CKR4-1]|uniref:restriction endonuclease subunit S n=1 Tax=Chryseobacterium sp. CKR4-1 TaxID=3068896 RepID=UPI002796773C
MIKTEEKKLKIGNVPNLRFPGFEGEWETKKLGDILQFKNGINASKEKYGKGVKFVNVSDILNNEFLTYDNIMGSVDIDNTTHEKYLVEYGDILFQRSSETREEVGTANVYLDIDKTATFGGFVIRGKKIGDYNPIFFNNLLKTNSSRNSITSKSGGSTRYNVGQETLNSVELFFPQIPEQNKIADLLVLLNQRVQTQNKII